MDTKSITKSLKKIKDTTKKFEEWSKNLFFQEKVKENIQINNKIEKEFLEIKNDLLEKTNVIWYIDKKSKELNISWYSMEELTLNNSQEISDSIEKIKKFLNTYDSWNKEIKTNFKEILSRFEKNQKLYVKNFDEQKSLELNSSSNFKKIIFDLRKNPFWMVNESFFSLISWKLWSRINWNWLEKKENSNISISKKINPIVWNSIEILFNTTKWSLWYLSKWFDTMINNKKVWTLVVIWIIWVNSLWNLWVFNNSNINTNVLSSNQMKEVDWKYFNSTVNNKFKEDTLSKELKDDKNFIWNTISNNDLIEHKNINIELKPIMESSVDFDKNSFEIHKWDIGFLNDYLKDTYTTNEDKRKVKKVLTKLEFKFNLDNKNDFLTKENLTIYKNALEKAKNDNIIN